MTNLIQLLAGDVLDLHLGERRESGLMEKFGRCEDVFSRLIHELNHGPKLVTHPFHGACHLTQLLFDILAEFLTLEGELPHVAGHRSKAGPSLSRARRFDGRIDCNQVALAR